MVASNAFMHFGHDSSGFIAVNAFEEYFTCSPLVEFIVHDDVMSAARF